MSTADEILKAMKKQYGDKVVNTGVIYDDATRLPTGIFPFDLATGGGFPVGRISILFGPESSLKTTIALKAIAHFQRSYPDKRCVFVDVENSYEPEWAATLGVNNNKLIYVLPEYAEQTVDIVEGLMYAEDVGLIVLDSLAALITANEIESSADKAVVGGSGLVVGKLYRKVTVALSRSKKEKRYPTFIAINQIRYKIVKFGDPEVMPGGQAFKFASSLTVRLYGKDEIDNKISEVLPAWKTCNGIIKKWKVPILARTFEFKLCTHPQEELEVGSTYDWNTVSAYLKDLGHLVKGDKGGWVLFGTAYPTLKAIKENLDSDLEFDFQVKNQIITDLMEQEDE